MEQTSSHDGPNSLLADRLLSSHEAVRPDNVTSYYYDLGVELNFQMLTPDNSGSKPLILIEGNREALLFLADLLLAQASDFLDCGFQINLPAPRLLSERSQYGVYIHALPCASESADQK